MMQYIPNLHVPHLQNGTEKEAEIEQPLNAEVVNAHRKRKAEEDTGAESKRRRSSDSAEDSLPCFVPAALVSAKEGTFKVPQSMQRYLDKHLKRCLTKEEADALFKEHPRPDLSCLAPAVDKYMRDFLGKRLPKSGDADLYKVQKSVLSVIRPMTSAWQMLEEGGLRDDPDLLVPAAEVLSLIQRTICLVGNTSELISQTWRARILEAVDPSLSKYGSEEFLSSSSTLFGEGFQETLSKRVEKDTALSKAVSIMKRAKRTEEPSPSSSSSYSAKRGDQRRHFFRGGPPAKYGGGQGRSFFPYNPHFSNRQGERDQPRLQSQNPQPRPGQVPLYHEPRLPAKTPQKWF